jgi:hypothetical protein
LKEDDPKNLKKTQQMMQNLMGGSPEMIRRFMPMGDWKMMETMI